MIPEKKIGHNQEGITLEPLGSDCRTKLVKGVQVWMEPTWLKAYQGGPNLGNPRFPLKGSFKGYIHVDVDMSGETQRVHV